MSDHTVLFVCLGNICRSPTAEGVFRHQLREAGLTEKFVIDSAGTGEWHVGSPPDPRAQAAALIRGFDISSLRARQISGSDFDRFDHIIAMDHSNYRDLVSLAGVERQHKVRLLLEFAAHIDLEEVPDPYYGGDNGFDRVIDLIETASAGLLHSILGTRPESEANTPPG